MYFLTKSTYNINMIYIGTFIESTSIDTTTITTKCTIDTYTLFAQKICSIFNNKSQVLTTTDYVATPIKPTFKSKIPKSLSAPINNLITRKYKNPKTINKDAKIQITGTSFAKLDENEVNFCTNLEVAQNNSNNNDGNSVTMRAKFARLFLGLGTYVVTCGSDRSRKLIVDNRAKNILKNSKTCNDLSSNKKHNNNKLVDKSWLLLSSHNSLNSLDDVFTS